MTLDEARGECAELERDWREFRKLPHEQRLALVVIMHDRMRYVGRELNRLKNS